MSHDVYDVIIVGAGPAGLSAAAHAHVCGLSYLLLEQGRLANTLDYYYPRGKFVMTLPALIPLRSDLPFTAGSREEVLRTWNTWALHVSAPPSACRGPADHEGPTRGPLHR